MKILITLLSLLCATTLWGQKIIDKNIPYSKGQKINLDLKFGEIIKINGWNKNEVGVKISVNINNNKLNDAMIVKFSEDKETISIYTDYDQELFKNANCEDCPDSNASYWNNKRICTNVQYEIYLPENADTKVETIHADMEIKDLTGPLVAKSISGFIDISLSLSQKADVVMKSITGECYSDVNIAFDDENSKSNSPVGVKIKGTINGGGTPLNLETISSNIYVRKEKG